jgi:2-oxoacid:acceptor oxidoreductase delta subunit (pyruvate/2-ketoisovalerate family)
VADGLKPGGTLIVNSTRALDDLKQEFSGNWKFAVVDATSIARELLRVNIVNTTMLGALIKATGLIEIDDLVKPLEEKFGARAKSNLDACKKAFSTTQIGEITTEGTKKAKSFAAEKLAKWNELLVGCAVTDVGNTKSFCTGDWKSQHPIWEDSRCIKCGICSLFCPEFCISQQKDGYFRSNPYYCKGCGICAQECWTQAIKMVEEA